MRSKHPGRRGLPGGIPRAGLPPPPPAFHAPAVLGFGGSAISRISGFVDHASSAVISRATSATSSVTKMAASAKAKAKAVAKSNPLSRLVRPRTKITPPFSLLFQELQRWNAGADIDAEFEAAAPVGSTYPASKALPTPEGVAV